MVFCSQSERVHRKQNVTDQLKATYRRTINSDVIIILKHASGSKGNIYTETLTVLLDRPLTKLMILQPYAQEPIWMVEKSSLKIFLG